MARGERPLVFALLRRQRKLAEVIVASEHISAFCQAIVEGCCRTVEKLELILPDSHPYLTNECTDPLAKAIAMDGLLPALRTLFVRDYSTQKERVCWAKLAEVLAEGAAPQLQRITSHTSFDKSGIVVLADMLEARARSSGCKRFQRFGIGNDGDWLDDEFSLETRIRLLRVLLPSVTKLPSCFHLARCVRCLLPGDPTAVSDNATCDP